MISMFKAIHYCQLMYLRNFQIWCLEIYELNTVCFLTSPGLAWKTTLQKDQSKARSFN